MPITIGFEGSKNSSSSSSIVIPYFLHDVYDPTPNDEQTLTTSYENIFSNNLHNQFDAEKTECIIELLVYNNQFAGSGRITSARLNGNNTTLDTDEFSILHGGNTTTEKQFFRADESDKPYITCVWHLKNLTIGTTYDLYPQMKSNSTSNHIIAGEDMPPCILRGYYLS